MKKLLLISFVTVLSGCSTISNIFMAPYDTNEYKLVNQVRTIAEVQKCDPVSIDTLYNTALEAKNFSEYLPRNDKTISMMNDLYTLVDELHKKDNPSATYCKLKLNIIGKSAEDIQQVIGNRPR